MIQLKKSNIYSFYSVLVIALFATINVAYSQAPLTTNEIKLLIEKHQGDIRGPYKDIRWFCADGSVRQPKDPCPENIGPGVQHARYKDDVVALGKSNHIYVGQILAYTSTDEFWDIGHNHSRLKQYQLDKYLRLVDDGWVNQKGQYYRGSVQVEDEEAWGIEFYTWVLAKDAVVADNFYLIRQSLKDIPHNGDDNLAQLMRSESKVISDIYVPFMDLRTKIHSQPEPADVQRVVDFKLKNQKSLTADLNKKLDALVVTMQTFFRPVDIQVLLNKSKLLKGTMLGDKIQAFIQGIATNETPSYVVNETAQLLFDIREGLIQEKRPIARMQLLDISLKLEELLFQNAPNWEATTISGQLEKICALTTASAGAGYLELWEWEQIAGSLSKFEQEKLSLAELTQVLETARSAVEWSAAMVKANYQEVVDTYTTFEPKSYAFIDDRIRGSIALHLGKSVGELGDFIAKESALTNRVLDISNQSTFRGLNPGYAFGELVVVDGSSEEIQVSSDKIYIFQRSPSDLKPVAGIATVAEGNLVSHVQLLARNLGIPNAALSDANLQSLKKYDGERVFYAVSNKGNVILKLEAQMTAQERALFVKKERNTDKIEVPIEKIQLKNTDVLNMRNVDASDSGALCGPKAANLGQLKKMFPEQVVEGLVIPFGIFRDHMDQQMPGQNSSYWAYLNTMFAEAERMRNAAVPEPEVENYQLRQLATLRDAIKKMVLKPDFMNQLETKFKTVLGSDFGNVPVFLRSDTNMEDLKDFTGAGLNLTLFNVLDKEKILNGIKEVWASPYTERSFKWRQKYLLNPENVFPSILVIPSVDVDYSGVLITKGINSGNEKDLTIAFSRGAGGAVDGQSAETYTIYDAGGYRLLAPARESMFNRLPVSGGTGKNVATFQSRVVNEQNLNEIRQLAKTIRETLPNATDSDYEGAYDVELGFKDDKLWLFQIRPFVENKKAVSSGYLESITPKINTEKEIYLSTKL
ncbi:PEP/pyruvate-binding domain-containing protein [Maribacter sp. ACAM166]|uniref:PEP/pyruvate-binding domain-containing protein n=1 Tax=Maribacter sp. ACAM166 TaxID=2508996 RepID=UPI0010FD00D8|nr:PEP/pyruvate-binding domain-containing protein [Maribacter sp. ACAM166]TLP75470.1 phosphoenolpyruvate synthase [Maribacter sp. ACAM166]